MAIFGYKRMNINEAMKPKYRLFCPTGSPEIAKIIGWCEFNKEFVCKCLIKVSDVVSLYFITEQKPKLFLYDRLTDLDLVLNSMSDDIFCSLPVIERDAKYTCHGALEVWRRGKEEYRGPTENPNFT